MNQIRNLFITNRDHLQFILFLMGGLILFLYSIILTFSPVIRVLSWNTSIKWEQWIALVIWILACTLIQKSTSKVLTNRDPFILPIIFLLSGIGMMTIFRLSISFGWRQLIWFLLGSLLVFIGVKFNSIIPVLRRYKYIWLILGLLVTILTFFFGIYPGGEGPQLWLGCCGIYFQPSEPLKLLFIIYLSAFFADNWALKKNLTVLIVPTIVMVAAAIMVLISQRDLGTASIFLVIYALFLFNISGRKRTLLIFLGIVLIAGFLGYQFIDLIRIRIDAWINPWLDPAGGSYQIIQSIQAIATGRILGSGPGLGSPGLVPVALSDFIYAAITEEIGLIGGLFIVALYAFLAYRGFLLTIKTRNQFQKLLALGLTIFLSVQSILIIGGNVRLLPLTGVTLPFISYGGSSLITVFTAGLILLLISQNQSSKSIEVNETKPILITQYFIIAGFFLLAFLTSYWTTLRSNDLVNRPDNIRKIINDRFVPRGDILDRKNNPILITQGDRGSFSRLLLDPSLSTTIGYNHPFYGKSGLEASLDGYLRGIAGIPSLDIFWNELIYARPPDGLDIRTTIDLQLQNRISEILGENYGAALLMNAKNGEILAIWSSPTFNANLIDEEWSTWLVDDKAPLLNRSTQGNYELGNLSSIFYYGYATENLFEFKREIFVDNFKCASPLPSNQSNNFQLALINGCSAANDVFSQWQNPVFTETLLRKYMWTENIEFDLPIQPVTSPFNLSAQSLNSIQFSPLQIARSSAAFSNSGLIPYPKLSLAVNSREQGWIVFPSKEPVQILDRSAANQTALFFARNDFPTWEITSTNFSEEQPIHWYVSGTLPNWQAAPMVFVMTLETGNSIAARNIGREVMEKILTSSN